MKSEETSFKIGELSRLTGVKAGTIRFYESCGFLEPAERLSNGYRIFCVRHIYQIRVCRLVFGGFVNRRLRKSSIAIIRAAADWDLQAYREAAEAYRRAVKEDITGTKRAIGTVMERMPDLESVPSKEQALQPDTDDFTALSGENRTYSKKQAAGLVGVTPEAVRNWERNGLLGQLKAYQRRAYSQWALNRMYVIRLLLDNGYSMMAICSFFAEFDAGNGQRAAQMLVNPGESESLIYRADRYMETLLGAEKKAQQLCALTDEMEQLSFI